MKRATLLRRLLPWKRLSAQSGMALIIVLVVTAFLVAVITEVLYSVHNYSSMTSLYVDGQKASMLAHGGIEIERAHLNELLQQDTKVLFLSDEDILREVEDPDGLITITVTDEQGKVSLNAIVTEGGGSVTEKKAIFVRLLNNLGYGAELADSLSDWIDKDNKRRSGGAESTDYYGNRRPPYRAKNAALTSLEELLLVKGFTYEIIEELRPFVTIYTDGRININTAPAEVIMVLDEDITESMAKALIEYRSDTPFVTTAAIRNVDGFSTISVGLQKKVTVRGEIFSVRSKAHVGESIKILEAVFEVKDDGKTLYWRES